MSAAYDKLKDLLTKQGTLSNEEVEKAIAEHGAMTDEEKLWLEAERHKLERSKGEKITVEQYMAACKVLDTAAPDSEDYKKAEAMVNKYESGG
jgi:hypothetical protein